MENQKEKIDNSQPIVSLSPASLEDKIKPVRKVYWVCLGLLGIGIVIRIALIIAVIVALFVYGLCKDMVDYQLDKVRKMKFKFLPGVGAYQMFITMQPIFIAKYNLLVEKGKEGRMILHSNGYMYDVVVNDDATFSIVWHMSVGKALTPKRKYMAYRQVIAAMGFISYEIQRAFGIIGG